MTFACVPYILELALDFWKLDWGGSCTKDAATDYPIHAMGHFEQDASIARLPLPSMSQSRIRPSGHHTLAELRPCPNFSHVVAVAEADEGSSSVITASCSGTLSSIVSFTVKVTFMLRRQISSDFAKVVAEANSKEEVKESNHMSGSKNNTAAK